MKRENISFVCMSVGVILGNFEKVSFIAIILDLIALVLSVISLVEEYKTHKGKKKQ